MQSADLQDQTCERRDSRQTITIGEASFKEDEESTKGKMTLKMFDALEEVLGRCKSKELSRTQLKAMLSKLTSIQNKVAEHIANSL